MPPLTRWMLRAALVYLAAGLVLAALAAALAFAGHARPRIRAFGA